MTKVRMETFGSFSDSFLRNWAIEREILYAMTSKTFRVQPSSLLNVSRVVSEGRGRSMLKKVIKRGTS